MPDDVYEEARRHFSEKELVDLTAAVIAIDAWNRVAIAFRPTPPLKRRETRGLIDNRNCLGAIKKTGAAERIRTSDRRITNALLYRLSYRGVSAARVPNTHHI